MLALLVVSLKYSVPVLSLLTNKNVLIKLHLALLLKIGAISVFLLVMRSAPTYLGGLNLQYLEIEIIAQTIYHLASPRIAETLLRALLNTIVKHYQLELGTAKQLSLLDGKLLRDLATPT